MGFVGGHEGAERSVGIPGSESASAPSAAISSEQAVALSALSIEGAGIFALGILTGALYHLVAFGAFGDAGVYGGVGFLSAVFYCGAIRVLASTHPLGVSRDADRARRALTTWIAVFLILAAVAFSLKIGATLSRGASLSLFAAGIPLVTAARVFVPRILARTRYARAYRGNEVLIAAPRGTASLQRISQQLRDQGCAGVHSFEFDGDCSAGEWPNERQKLLRRLISTARIAGPGEIYVLSGSLSEDRIASVLSGLRLVPRAVNIVPSDAVSGLFGLPLRRVGTAVAVETQRAPMSLSSRAVKRAIDISVAGAALIFAAPVMAMIALAIKLDSPGPVLFRQRRNGYHGRAFRIAKFRTMSVLEDGDTVTQVRDRDGRVTRVGRWLRKTSFDELPQLFNILHGEMSLVGPRPHALAHDELYGKLIENYELRQHVKPGITGWAQINGLRGETPTLDLMFRRIEFDLWYAANSSVLLDLQILLRTVYAVLRQDNAY